MLGRVGGRAAADALLDRAMLLGQTKRLSIGAEDVGCRRRLDRRGHLQVGRRGQINRRGQIQAEIDVGIHVEQRKNFLPWQGKRTAFQDAPTT
jgi:hypothetical protein